MRKLQVEELEPRHLLNGTGFSHQPPPPLPSFLTLGTVTIRVAEPAPFVYLDGGRETLIGWGTLEERETSIAAFVPRPVDYATPEAVETDVGYFVPRIADYRPPDLRLAATDSPEPPASGGLPYGSHSPQAAPFRGPQTAEVLASAILPVAAGSGTPAATADASREANAAAVEAVLGTPSPRPNLPPPSPLESQVVITGLRLDVQALSAIRPPSVGAVREGLVAGATINPSVAVQGGAQSEEGPVLPDPQVSGILAALPAADLSALKLGMQQFVEQLEQVGLRLTSSRDGMVLYLWITAGVTAVAACEIARRQLPRGQESGVRSQESGIGLIDL
jgi:hypothetical protein